MSKSEHLLFLMALTHVARGTEEYKQLKRLVEIYDQAKKVQA